MVDLKRPHFQEAPYLYTYGTRVSVKYKDTHGKKEYFAPGIITDNIETRANLESIISVNLFLNGVRAPRRLGLNKNKKKTGDYYLDSIPAVVFTVMYACRLGSIKGAQKKLMDIN